MDISLVCRLVSTQFPQWKDLPIRPVSSSGWDNHTFHLGEKMVIRMPSAAEYALQVEKEQKWLPKLAPFLPVAIPEPLAMGNPAFNYPWKWSIYRWIEGNTAALSSPLDLMLFAVDLAHFLIALQQIDTTGGPPPGPHSFYRGGSLTHYDAEMREAIGRLQGKIDTQTALEIWGYALKTTCRNLPVWVHGDISAGNLLLQEKKLSAVIDFGQLTVGDPACDLAIAWTLFKGESREAFRSTLQLDGETWARGRAWALWKALIIAAGLTKSNAAESSRCLEIIDEIFND